MFKIAGIVIKLKKCVEPLFYSDINLRSSFL